MLVIGSAAGVAFMGIEEVDFLWYLTKVHQLLVMHLILYESFHLIFGCSIMNNTNSHIQLSGFALAGIAAYVAAQHLQILCIMLMHVHLMKCSS